MTGARQGSGHRGTGRGRSIRAVPTASSERTSLTPEVWRATATARSRSASRPHAARQRHHAVAGRHVDAAGRHLRVVESAVRTRVEMPLSSVAGRIVRPLLHPAASRPTRASVASARRRARAGAEFVRSRLSYPCGLQRQADTSLRSERATRVPRKAAVDRMAGQPFARVPPPAAPVRAIRTARFVFTNSAATFKAQQRASEAERVGFVPHEPDDVGDVFLERQPQLGGALAQVVARHAARERLVLHALDHRRRFEVEHALRRPHQRRGGDEPGHLVAGEERLLERALPRHARVAGVREDRARAPTPGSRRRVQLLAAPERVIVERGIALVVDVVQQRHDAPRGLVLAGAAARSRAPPPPPRARACAGSRSASTRSAASTRHRATAKRSLPDGSAIAAVVRG